MSDPRWKCPKCGGTNVQVCYPAWFKESSDYELVHVDTDTEADIRSWWCEACNEGGPGKPEEHSS